MIYLQLFQVFVLVGLLGFGGGYGATALMQELIVTQRGWLTMKEFADVVTLSGMTPGPLGINIASIVGVQLGGILGTVVATFSYVLPSIVIVLLLSKLYLRYRQLNGVQRVLLGLQPAVCALILSTAVQLTGYALWGDSVPSLPLSELLSPTHTNWIAAGLCLAILILLQKKKISPLLAIFVSGAVGAGLYALLDIPVMS